MKKIITIAILLLSVATFSQEKIFMGVAKVTDENNGYFHIVGKDAYFIIEQPTKGNPLKVGLEYFFFVKRIEDKNSKATGFSWYCHEDSKQHIRERNRIWDSISNQPIYKL